MPNKRPNFQRIIETDDPPKIIEPPKPEEPKVQEETPYFQKRTVRFDTPKTPNEDTYRREAKQEEEKPYYEPNDIFSNPKKDPEEEKAENENDGYYFLRKNYQRVKPGSKYTQEGLRPESPNLPYSFLSPEMIKNNPQNTSTFYEPTIVLSDGTTKIKRHYIERSTDCYNQHLIRGLSAPQPYCFITKEAKSNFPPIEYTNSRYGAYPPWGIEETGFRTRSHYIAEPANRFGNIDMYKRPLTNQPGTIIFDHGRPNNGYYLQRHQYENTWYKSKIKLNQQGILKDIGPKTKAEYDFLDESHKSLIRSKSNIWPQHSEYTQKFALKQDA